MSDQFEYDCLAHLDSTALEVVAYNSEDASLFVRFTNGNERVYRDVDESEYDNLVAARSAGRYYNAEIYGAYTSVPLSDTELIPTKVLNEAAPTIKAEDLGGLLSTNMWEPYPPFAPVEPQPWVWTTTTTGSNLSKYGVKYSIVNTLIISEPQFDAVSEDDALRQFHEAFEKSLPGVETKVLAVTHYFE